MKTLMLFIIILPLLLISQNNYSQQSWVPTSLINAPVKRHWHTAVWTGNEMVIWGGQSNTEELNTGGKYDLSTNAWIPTSIINAPLKRQIHTAVWTGSRMIIWGGICFTCSVDTAGNTGGIYDPENDNWVTTTLTNAPTARSYHTTVWTGSKMIVWGGFGPTGITNTGGIYDPETNTWDSISTVNAPSGRSWHTAVWTGNKMIIWGGDTLDFDLVNTGGIYDPITDNWLSTSTLNAPSPRIEHSSVWTGTEMIIWGGVNSTYDNSGGRYNPVSDSWLPTEITNAPQSRYVHTSVWTGVKMVIWGGIAYSNYVLNTGGIYDPISNSWTAVTLSNAPFRRYLFSSVWTGEKMIIWGGCYEIETMNTGGVYSNPTIIGIQSMNGEIPKYFQLEQNYPNPFNPRTNIKFHIPFSRFTSLKIYDSAGKSIIVLVNEFKNAGYYEVKFDGSNLASGVYFYRLEAGDLVATKKMVLVK